MSTFNIQLVLFFERFPGPERDTMSLLNYLSFLPGFRFSRPTLVPDFSPNTLEKDDHPLKHRSEPGGSQIIPGASFS